MQTYAVMCARSGDPWQGLELLQLLARGDWLEKRTSWRHTLMVAWATYRAGRGEAGVIAARGLEQAAACGTVRVATAGEPEVVAALGPLAEAAGSALARELMLDGRELIVRLFGTPEVVRRDGRRVALPPGRPGELVRMLAVHEHGLAVDAVLEAFSPRPRPPRVVIACVRCSPACARPPASSSSATVTTCASCPPGSICGSSGARATGCGPPAAHTRRSSSTRRSRYGRDRCSREIPTPSGHRTPVTRPSTATSSCSTSSPAPRRPGGPIERRSPRSNQRSPRTPIPGRDGSRWPDTSRRSAATERPRTCGGELEAEAEAG